MRKVIVGVVTLGTVWVSACWGQQARPEPLSFDRANTEGFHLYGVSTTFSYSSFSLPPNIGQNSILEANSDMRSGVTGAVGWQRLHGRGNFTVNYTGSYNLDLRQSNLNSLNHNLMLGFNRTLGRKWSVDVVGYGQDLSIEQFIFQSPTLGAISQTPASFDDLAAAMSVGQFTNTQSSLLLNSTAGGSPLTAVLLGSHVLSYSMQAGLSYAHSTRLSFRFGSVALGGQHRTGNNIPGFQQNYILPRTIGADASMSIHFSLSPRTQLDWGVSQNYMTSRYQKAAGTSATAGLGRKMARNWFLRAFAGAYINENVQQTTGKPQTRQMIGGGSVGFQTYGNTFLASYNRTGYDLSGGGLGGTNMITAAWNWRRPRNNWGINVSFSRTETNNPGFSNINGWQITAGISQRLKNNLLLDMDYTHVSSRGAYLALANDVTINAVRISLAWSPHFRQTSTGRPVPEGRDQEEQSK